MNFWVIVATWSIFWFERVLSFTYLPDYIVALGASEAAIGFMGSVRDLIAAVVQLPGGYVGDYHGRRVFVVKFTWLIVFITMLYVIAPSWWLIPVALALESLARVYIPALRALFADSVPPERRARAH